MAEGKQQKKKRAPFKRLVMRQEDRDTIRRNLLFTFKLCGASDAQALRAATNGSHGGMEVWIQRWITHNTDYVEKGLTEDNYRKGCFAWIYYKATAEVVTGLDVKQETKDANNELQRNRLARIDKETGDAVQQ